MDCEARRMEIRGKMMVVWLFLNLSYFLHSSLTLSIICLKCETLKGIMLKLVAMWYETKEVCKSPSNW